MLVACIVLFVYIGVAQGGGCAKQPDTKVLVPNRISACAGKFSGGVFDNSTLALCGKGYHVCRNETETSRLGLTKVVCGFNGSNDPNMFYISQQGGVGWDCNVQNVPNIQSVFGCGGGTYIHAATACGVLADCGSSGEEIGYPDTMGVTDDNDNLHTVYNDGDVKTGVICCVDHDT
mmetsp:Transcript_35567/g.43939  ORF Transcript_35567/g.43939 Transcript_35567/m.43939 type:complete len:176 (+) Transcript_35567:45-572(+)